MGLGSVNVPGLSQAERKILKTLLVTEELDTITWDLEDTGVSVVVNDSLTFYHVSDAVPTVEDLKDGYTIIAGSKYIWDEVSCSSDNVSNYVVDGGNYIILKIFDRVIIALEDNVTVVEDIYDTECVLPKAGIYFSKYNTGSGVVSLTIPGYTFGASTYLNPDYIPEIVARKEDIEPFIISAWESAESGVLSTDKTLVEVAAAVLKGVIARLTISLDNGDIVLTFAGFVTDGIAFTGVLGSTCYTAVITGNKTATISTVEMGGSGSSVVSAEGVEF